MLCGRVLILAYFLDYYLKTIIMGLSGHEDHSNIQQELDQLDETLILLENKLVKPSQCYHYASNPAHLLYNTNCPEDLKAKLEAILLKYTDGNEDSSAA